MAPATPACDYYAILEVAPSATLEEIRTSYFRLVRLHHPDKNNGLRSATAKTQLINAAWEVLKDSCKKIEYDRNRAQHSNSTSSRPYASKPTSTPQWNYQPPKPSGTAQEDAKAKAESQKKRQEWLNWERAQENSIRQCQKKVRALEAEIAALNAKVNESKAKIANDVPYWWNVFASLSKRMSEAEKNELRRQVLDGEAAVRIKEVPLDCERLLLYRLKNDLSIRQEKEKERLAAELKEKERKEKLARDKAQAEAFQRHMEEFARQQAAREAREKAAREEAIRAESARQKRMAEERAASEAAYKRWQEEQAKAAKAESERLHEIIKEQMAKDKRAKGKGKHRQSRETSCQHRRFWDKIQGSYDCAHCTRPLYKFAYQCPGCQTIACVSCRVTLRAGGTPSIDTSYTPRRQSTRSYRANGNSHYVPSPTPSPPRSFYHDYDDYDWD